MDLPAARPVRAYALLTALLVVACGPAAAAAPRPPWTADPALKLFREGKPGPALQAVGYSVLNAGPRPQFVRRAEEYLAAGRVDDALGYYEMYLYYFPFGRLFEGEPLKEWVGVAAAYAGLLERHGRTDTAARRQTVAAAETFQKLTGALRFRNPDEHARLVGEIIRNYPRSIYCQMAVVLTCTGPAVQPDKYKGNADAPVPYAEYLRRMREAGIPERDLVLVRLGHRERVNHQATSQGKETADVFPPEEQLQLTDNPYVRQWALTDLGTRALRAGDLARAGEVFRQYADEVSAAALSDAPHLSVVMAYVSAGRSEAGEAWVRAAAKADPDVDPALSLNHLAEQHLQRREYAPAIRLWEEVAGRDGGRGRWTSTARLSLARAYGAGGDEAKMLALYKELAAAPPVDTQAHVMDASNTRNAAYEALGRHYLARKDWAEALRWWRAWSPSSWCGNCYDGMVESKVYYQALCLWRLGRAAEALPLVEPFVVNRDAAASPATAVLVVDLARELSKQTELEAKIRPLVGGEDAAGAKAADEYMRLLRDAAARDVPALWRRFEGREVYNHVSSPDWRARKAAELLAGMPDVARPFALAMAGADRDRTDQQWAFVLLCRWKDPAALDLIRQYLRRHPESGSPAACFYALTLLGTPEAYELIGQYATGKGLSPSSWADFVLLQYPPPAPPGQPRRQPERWFGPVFEE